MAVGGFNLFRFGGSKINPVPVLTTITPDTISHGSSAQGMTLDGHGFRADSVAKIGSTSMTTVYVSEFQLTCTVPGSELAAAGSKNISVFNTTPGGGTSGNVVLTISTDEPVPVLNAISPTHIHAGVGNTTITLTGINFASDGGAFFDAIPITSVYISDVSATATISSAYLGSTGSHTIKWNNPGTGGGDSNTKTFLITAKGDTSSGCEDFTAGYW